MKITQISVFLENRKGRLYEVCKLLGEKGVNILALTIAETEEFGVLRIVVNKPDDALKILKESGWVASQTEVVVAEVEDHPGGLAKLLGIINDGGLNIEYMHAVLSRKSSSAYMVFRFDDADAAIRALSAAGVKLVSADQIVDL